MAPSCTAECVTWTWRTRRGKADVVSPFQCILLIILNIYVDRWVQMRSSLSLCWELPAAAAFGNMSVSLVLSDRIQCDVGICKQKCVVLWMKGRVLRVPGPSVSCWLKPVQELFTLNRLGCGWTQDKCKNCQLNFSKSLSFYFTSNSQNAARTVSNFVSGGAGEEMLLLADCTGACNLLLSTSALLPLWEQLSLIVCPSNHKYRSKAFRGLSYVPLHAEWISQDAAFAAWSFYFCNPEEEALTGCYGEIGAGEVLVRRRSFYFLKVLLQVPLNPLACRVCVYTLLFGFRIISHGPCSSSVLREVRCSLVGAWASPAPTEQLLKNNLWDWIHWKQRSFTSFSKNSPASCRTGYLLCLFDELDCLLCAIIVPCD